MGKNFPQITIKKQGNWAGATWNYKMLNKSIRETIVKEEKAIAKELYQRVRAHIRDQDLPWKRPSKNKRGSKLMIHWGTYYHSITTGSNKLEAWVGVRKGLYHPRTGQEIHRIATWQEYGTNSHKHKIPKRPLWGPSIEEMGGRQAFVNRVEKKLRAKMKRMGRSTKTWDVY